MKRCVSFILCIILIFTHFSVFSAKNSVSTSTETVLTLIKSRIPDTGSFSEFDSQILTENNVNTYNFFWNQDQNKSIYVCARENGIITDYNFHINIVNEKPTTNLNRISLDEAIRRTQILVNELNPMLTGKIFVETSASSESLSSENFYFVLRHKEGGVYVHGDTGRVVVDKTAENIQSFHIGFTENLEYVSPYKILTEEDAKLAFENEIGLTPSYHIYRDLKNRKVIAFPVYKLKDKNIFIDAHTGKAIDVQSFYAPFSEDSLKAENSANDTAGSLTTAEMKEIENLNKLIPQDTLEEMLRKTEILGITKKFTLQESTLRKVAYKDSSYTRSFLFSSNSAEKASFIFLDVDAANGEVLSFSGILPDESGKKLDNDTILSAAENYLLLLAPSKYSEYILNPDCKIEDGFLKYTRYVNGLMVDSDYITVEVDTFNKALVSYRINYTDTVFPVVEKIKDMASICSNYFENVSYRPIYIPQKSNPKLAAPDKTILVYSPDDSGVMLDAFTGKRLNNDGTAYQSNESTSHYADISGHWAEEKITALKRFGVGFDSSNFYPDRPISQKDFIDFASKGLNGKITIYDLKSPAANLLTRIEAARLVCCALGVEKYAKIEEIFTCPFRDVISGKGYVSMLWGIGIINGTSKNTFSPNEILTRAEAAVLIYNTMENM